MIGYLSQPMGQVDVNDLGNGCILVDSSWLGNGCRIDNYLRPSVKQWTFQGIKILKVELVHGCHVFHLDGMTVRKPIGDKSTANRSLAKSRPNHSRGTENRDFHGNSMIGFLFRTMPNKANVTRLAVLACLEITG